MKAEEYHPVLRSLEDACCLAQSSWICLPNPLVGWSCEGTFLWRTGVLLRHFALISRCWRALGHRHILVREFSTIPLLTVFPLLWPLRKKIYFLIHHNLQWAARSRIERLGMIALARMGARWAFFETQDFPMFGKFCLSSQRNLVLPHPVPGNFSGPWEKNGSPVIGVAGYCRPEKGMDELLRLLTAHFSGCEIIAGVPNPADINIPSVKVLNTALDEAYRRMLAQCDVLVQNGARDSYFYRASGPVADAAACGTAVVAPDFPIIGKQVEGIGEVFQTLEKMPVAVRTAVEKVRAGQYDFKGYCKARSAQALADLLDTFVRRQNE